MKALHFMGMRSSKFGGLEKYILEIANQFRDNGDSLYVIYNEPPKSPLFVEQLNKLGVSLIINNLEDNSFYKMFLEMKMIIYQIKPDIVHFHFGRVATYGPFLCFFLGVKRLYRTIHSMPFENYLPNIKSKIYYSFLNLICKNIFCVSNAIQKDITQCVKAQKYKIQILYIGTPLEKTGDHKYSEDLIRITCVAFHHPIKGIDVLLKSLHLLKEKYNCTNFICNQIGAGDRQYTNKLKELAKELELNDNISWLGLRNDVPDILSETDIYCQPSRNEGIGIAIMEACAQAIPIVATRVGGIPEIVKDNKNGLLCNSEDYETMSENLHKLIMNKKLLREMGNESYKIVQKNFNLHNNVQLLIYYYQ